jgi:hypothetical protein
MKKTITFSGFLFLFDAPGQFNASLVRLEKEGSATWTTPDPAISSKQLAASHKNGIGFILVASHASLPSFHSELLLSALQFCVLSRSPAPVSFEDSGRFRTHTLTFGADGGAVSVLLDESDGENKGAVDGDGAVEE